MILTSDIGGTHCRLALWQWHESLPRLIREATFDSRGLDALPDWICDFLDGVLKEELEGAVICLAGPVERDFGRMTNLPFRFDYAELRQKLGFLPFIDFHNDLKALAAALPLLQDADVHTVQAGKESAGGTKAVIAPGTGLGEAFLLDAAAPCPSEGGHGDFAPRTGEQWALYRFLAESYGHVSYERILSGPGISDAHRFFSFMAGNGGDRLDPQLISRLALMGGDGHCLRALSLFRAVLAAEAGNLALRTVARGGVYIGGGIAPEIASFLDDDEFRRHFADKGRFRPFLEDVPVHILLRRDATLLGACALARLHHPLP